MFKNKKLKDIVQLYLDRIAGVAENSTTELLRPDELSGIVADCENMYIRDIYNTLVRAESRSSGSMDTSPDLLLMTKMLDAIIAAIKNELQYVALTCVQDMAGHELPVIRMYQISSGIEKQNYTETQALIRTVQRCTLSKHYALDDEHALKLDQACETMLSLFRLLTNAREPSHE